MDLLSAIAAILLTKLDEEVQTNCPNLSRIPSTGIIKFLDHFASLPAAERGPLLEVMARLGAMQFFPPQQIAAEHERLRTSDPAYAKFWAAMQSPAFSYGLRYCDLKMARMMLNDQQSLDAMVKAAVHPGLAAARRPAKGTRIGSGSPPRPDGEGPSAAQIGERRVD